MSEYWAGTPNSNNGNDGIQFLFPHWTCGGFAGSVATLQNPANQASANYVIEEDRVAQLVNEGDTSWHCGNSWYNHRSISYELVGWPGYPPTEGTLDTCARMMAEASRNYFGGAALVLGENVLLHRMVSSTACPGETDINRLLQLANGYLGGSVPTPSPAPAPSEGGDFDGGTYVVNVDELNVRDYPSLGGGVVASYYRGQTINLDNWCVSADGYIWARYVAYSGATRYVAVGPDTGSPEANDYLVKQGGSAPATPPSSGGSGADSGIRAGSYTVQVNGLQVRVGAGTSFDSVANYDAGQTVNLDGTSYIADGYVWGRYVGASGYYRYIAVRSTDGSVVYAS